MPLTAPAADEMEITLLGRGFGESIVLHMGDGNWVITDSFLTSHGRAAPLEYLASMGVSPSSVKVILATHWHDDHVAGLAQIYENALDADLVFSIALEHDEFSAFIEKEEAEGMSGFTSGVTELARVSEINERENRKSVICAAASTTIYRRDPGQTSFGQRAELVALSPSAGDVNGFLRSLHGRIRQHATRVRRPRRNPSSVAAWASVGNAAVLLGADLEHAKRNPNSGWNAILSSSTRPSGKAQVFKIPHHGSPNAHHQGVWDQMLDIGVIAALAPFNRGKGRPQAADISRLKARTSELYTAKQRAATSFKAHPAVLEKMINAGGAQVLTLPTDIGYVQLRKRITSTAPWAVKLGGGAVKL